MKSKILVPIFLLITMLIFVSCNISKDDNSPVDSDVQDNLHEKNENQIPSINDAEDIKPNDESYYKYPIIPLDEVSYEQLQNARLYFRLGRRTFLDMYLTEFQNNIDTLSYNYENTILRNSTRALYCDGINDEYDTDLFDKSLNNEKFIRLYEFSSHYDLKHQAPILKINGYSDDSSNIKIESLNLGYIASNITVNGFIKRNDDGKTFNIIIDPAYMYGLPVYHDNVKDCEFNINGVDVKADTLQFTGEYAGNDDKFKDIDDKYQYVKLKNFNLSVEYEVYSGYSSTAYLTEYLPISADTSAILSGYTQDAYIGKDPDMELVYNTLISNLELINTEDTLGIVLLDLDFDEFPELLVSRQTSYDDEYQNKQEVANVDIYRIKGDEIVYIDTLYNYHTIVYELGNILGIKTLDDNTKAWFNMSYIDRNTSEVCDTDYLFTLEGDKLIFTEVFKTKADGYYYYGEKMIFEQKTEYNAERQGDITYTSWNEYRTVYGEGILIGVIKEAYCEDMKNSAFTLYSDWLAKLNPYETSVKKNLTKRTMEYDIANLVDAFFLGEYNFNKKAYEYRFLGDFAKPVIYLYPEIKTDISVEVDLNGALTCTYPRYKNGWNVTAYPDGTLINKDDNREYSYLYWEGKGNAVWDLSKGFVVKGSDTIEFLQEKLEYMGLTPRELNEFIVYWLPYMQDNKYNLITFQTDIYEENAKLNINPKPDSMLRIFMVFKPLDEYMNIEEQKLSTFERTGFSVVEWGGSMIE